MLLARRNIIEHGREQRLIKVQEVSKAAATARSNLNKKIRELRASLVESSPRSAIGSRQRSVINSIKPATEGKKNLIESHTRISSTGDIGQPRSGLPFRNPPADLLCFKDLQTTQIFFLIEAPFL